MPGPGPQIGIPLVDTGNQLLAEQPAQLTTGKVDTTAGQRLGVTIRTATTTLTILLNGKDAQTWAAQLTREADTMSVAGLVVSNGGHIAAPSTQPPPA